MFENKLINICGKKERKGGKKEGGENEGKKGEI